MARGGAGNVRFRLWAGTNGDDKFYGELGRGTIFGDSGRDQPFGGAGDDSIDGGTGKDRPTGGIGRNTMTGGSGADTLVFAANEAADLVKDFDLALDTIRVSGAVTIIEAGGDAVLRIGTGRVTLDGNAAADLVMDDHIVII